MIMEKIYVFKPRTSEEFLLQLRALKYMFTKKKLIRLLIIDPINIFEIFSTSGRGMKYNYKKFHRDSNSKDERKSIPAKVN